MPHRLHEISALTVLDSTHLGAIQDEKGILYVLDLTTGAVVSKKIFGKDGDYEGLEVAGDRLFVLRSDGVLFEIADWRAEELKTRKRKTGLSARNDNEGLAYDPVQNRLLIACKEYPGKGLKFHRAIYAYDLEQYRLSNTPVFSIDERSVRSHLRASDDLGERIRDALLPVADLSDFKPSGLAIHPLTREMYLVSSVLKVVVVLSPEGVLTAVHRLAKKLFPQPEGITFLPNGDLFISNEGHGEKGTVLQFSPLARD